MYPWKTKRRMNMATDYLRKQFGSRIQKVAIDAGFTCPNRDGTVSTGGCAYCNNNAFNPSYCSPEKPISRQIKEGIEFHEKRYRSSAKYFAYFQAYSNTYGTLERLKECYSEAFRHKDVIGLIIGTRPDCIDEKKLEYLAELSKKYYVVIEFGIESTCNETLKAINRGHDFEKAQWALNLTSSYGIKSGAHFIFGLPSETKEEMLASADIISALPLHSVKFHQLQIVEGTRFALEYDEDPARFQLYGMEEYIELIVEFLTRLNPDFIIERLASETQPRNNHLLNWELRYDQVLQRIEKRMEELDVWQGMKARSWKTEA